MVQCEPYRTHSLKTVTGEMKTTVLMISPPGEEWLRTGKLRGKSPSCLEG